jgi:hypothetical protein
MNGPDQALDSNIDNAASDLDKWLFARARIGEARTGSNSHYQHDRHLSLHGHPDAYGHRGTDVLHWLGVSRSHTNHQGAKGRGRLHQQQLSHGNLHPQFSAPSARGRSNAYEASGGDSVIDSAPAESASVRRALSRDETREESEMQRMEDREAMLQAALSSIQNGATANRSISSAFVTLRSEVRAKSAIKREEDRIRTGESAFIAALEKHNLNEFDGTLSRATLEATRDVPEHSDKYSKSLRHKHAATVADATATEDESVDGHADTVDVMEPAKGAGCSSTKSAGDVEIVIHKSGARDQHLRVDVKAAGVRV